MGNRYINNLLLAVCGLFLLVTMYSCANMASPNGGPYDEAPPKFVSSLPAPNQTNYKGKKVEILFDELVQLDKPSENVIITPPQMQLPVIRAAGKKVVVELKDTLKENTTYTIDFTNSISDNNEKNVFENFSFAFSTGDVIDTLEVSGVLLNAENLEPMPGITVGLHKNLEDSAFVKLPFDRTSRTNDKGEFTIRNISPGSYRIFGLNDVNRDYKFDQPGEEIAFNDSIIIPSLELTSRQDTLWKDSLTSDSLNILRPQTDTLQFLMRHRPEKKKKKKDDEPEPIVFLGMQIDAPTSMDLFDTVSVTFNEPVLDLPKEVFYLDQKVDTVWTPVDFDFFRDSVNTLNYFIRRPWKYGEEYRLSVDSATVFSLYDKWNEPYSSEFKIKKEDEYGHLYLNIEGIDTTAYVELLNGSDVAIRKTKVKNGGALFMDLKPDKYYVRLVVDLNDNGKWDTGNYAEKRQPEEVFYSPVKYNVMQNWQVEETWNVKATPWAKQKPIEITKNKPKEATKKKRNYKDEGQQKSSSRSSSGSMGMPF